MILYTVCNIRSASNKLLPILSTILGYGNRAAREVASLLAERFQLRRDNFRHPPVSGIMFSCVKHNGIISGTFGSDDNTKRDDFSCVNHSGIISDPRLRF